MKTTCESIELLLAEYMGGELADADRERVARHLEECPACREELAREERLRQSFGAVAPAACPPGVTAAVRAAIAGPAPARLALRRRLHPAWAGAAAGLALAAAVVVLVLVAPPRSPRPGAPATVVAIDSTAAAERSATLERLRARRDVEWALSRTAAIVDRTEKESLAGVLRLLVPADASGS